ncbi:MAG TPA: type II toxin-antitoxin system PemK/MazF family toxin [Candidatus Sulfopaludibacter sp.]|jgi:mRNA interferase MazF|nr:type II toxin-antitoxin system PemK/MazF family toxin [Candidatus Sulfopaludibacter sp.]
MMNACRRGEVWLVDLGQPKQEEHEQAGRRPAVIFQTDDLSQLNTVVIVPLTTQSKRAGFANTVWIPAMEAGQERDSVALCHQIRALDRRKLLHKIGELAPERLSEIELAVLFVLGIPS